MINVNTLNDSQMSVKPTNMFWLSYGHIVFQVGMSHLTDLFS